MDRCGIRDGVTAPEERILPPCRTRSLRKTNAALLMFVTAAIAFAAIGFATAVWISRSSLADPYRFGPTTLWSSMDPVGAYFADILFFFDPVPIDTSLYYHPGLPMTLMAATVAKSVYAVHSLFSDTEGYIDHWVRRRILLNGILAGLANVMLLACCHPLFLVLRHFMERDTAYVGCTVFLLSVPVLLWVSRFSPEAWMLYFTLWSIHLSLLVLDGRGGWRTSAAMGACSSLAIASKVLVTPLIALNLYCLLSAPGRAQSRAARFGAFCLAAGSVAGLLLYKISVPDLITRLAHDTLENRGVSGIAAVLSLPHQRPFAVHHALVFGLGSVGLAVMYRALPQLRRKLVVLVATIALMALVTLRRPFWSYFFGFYWLFPAAAVYGLAHLIRSKRASARRDLAALAAGLIVVVTCHAWAYPGIAGTYHQYLETFRRRAAMVREHPAWAPAPWELARKDFEATRDPAAVVTVYGRRLDAAMQRQRQAEGR